LLGHKTLNSWRRRQVYDEAQRAGFDEDLALDPCESLAYEGTRTNLFILRDAILHTPATDGRLLPGVMRAIVLKWARALGFRDVADQSSGLPLAEIRGADEVFLTNAVRGIIPVGRCDLPGGNGELSPSVYRAPGPWTVRLWTEVERWLKAGGTA
jgi:branched-subunit amino acid aminotransferase/4-amino-4-deoxychorismate lyase